jgi:hypothetical protein
MKFLDLCVYIIIALCYNLFVHQVTSMLYKNYTYEEKYNKSITFIFIAGILGIVIAKLMVTKYVVNMGLTLGGGLLILTSIIVNWDNMTDDLKLCMSAVGFGAILWYFNNYYDNTNTQNTKIKKTKSNIVNKKQIISEEEIINMES